MRISSNIALTCSLLLAAIAPPALAEQTAPTRGVERELAMTPYCANADKNSTSLGKSGSSVSPTSDLDRDIASLDAAVAKAATTKLACNMKVEMHQRAEAIAMRNRDILRNLQIGNGSTH